jgi:hypothetical protein
MMTRNWQELQLQRKGGRKAGKRKTTRTPTKTTCNHCKKKGHLESKLLGKASQEDAQESEGS